MFLLTKYWIAPCAQRFLRWDEDGMPISARYLATARRLTSMPRAESVRRSASSESGAARVLCANEALQPLLDRVGRDCRVGADRRGEKAAHGDDPALELKVFILRRTAHGGGADAHFSESCCIVTGSSASPPQKKPCCSRPMSVSICTSVSQRVWTPLMRACASESFSFT